MNFADPDLIADPYPTYARWLANQPIWKAEDTGQWVLTRHDDVRSVLKSSSDYSSKAMGEQGNPLPLLTDDPPKHTALRKLVDRAFTVRMLRLMEDWVESLAGEMVAELPVGEPVDIVQALTIPLPVANAEFDDKRLTDQEIVGFCILLLIPGNETTTNLLGNFFNIVADRPEIWSALVESPELIDAAVEETLRFDAPVQFLMRKATRPMHYHGQDIAAGENVTVVMAAANRDPSVYDEPDEFRLDRKKNHHHSFGFGIHFCIGAPLARMEARLVLKALVQRFASVSRPAEPPGEDERVGSSLLRGFHHLWLTLHG